MMMVCIQLHESAAHDLRGLVIPCHPQHSAFRRAGIHQKIHDLMDGIFLIRAEPEQEFYLQRLIKIILKLLQNCAFGSTRIAVRAILYLCFAPVRINATSQLVPFRLGASQGFSFLPL